MGSYTPPSSAGVTTLFREFSFEQLAEVAVIELQASPKIFKTLQIRNIPLDAGNTMLNPLIVLIANSNLIKGDGAVTLSIGIAAYTVDHVSRVSFNPRHTRLAATYGQNASSDSSVQAIDFSPDQGCDIAFDAFVNGAGSGAIKNWKITAYIFIPEGATVTEV